MINILLILIISEPYSLISKWSLKDTWKSDVFVGGIFLDAAIISKERLAILFLDEPVYLVDRKRASQLAPKGFGPKELSHPMALCFDFDRLAVWEMQSKIKIFQSNKNDQMLVTDAVFRKATASGVIPHAFTYSNETWFVAGSTFSSDPNDPKIDILKAYDNRGVFIENIISKDIEIENRQPKYNYPYMFHHLKSQGDILYLIPEYEFKVFVVDPSNRKLLRTIQLKPPSFYKEMPSDSYAFSFNTKKHLEIVARWRKSYSRIENFSVDNDELILQVRVSREKMPKFAMLTYSLPDAKLKNIIYCEDLFIEKEGDVLYLLRGGDPGTDDEAGQMVIDIYEERK